MVGGEEDSGAVTRREGRRISEKGQGDRWRGNRVEKGRRNKGGTKNVERETRKERREEKEKEGRKLGREGRGEKKKVVGEANKGRIEGKGEK